MSYSVRKDVEDSVKDMLNDPGSYKKHGISAMRSFAKQRGDGSLYYERVVVDFGARNAFGGMVRGYATVYLEEDAAGECKVTGTQLN